MNRGTRILVAASALLAALAFGQGIRREAPKDVVLGRMVVTAPPQVTIDAQPDRLSPGSRIRDLNNMLVFSGRIVGKDLPVVYRWAYDYNVPGAAEDFIPQNQPGPVRTA